MSINIEKAAEHYRKFLAACGIDIAQNEDMVETPERVASWVVEATKNYRRKPIVTSKPVYDREMELKLTVFPAENLNELVFEGGMTFTSLCAHHMLPFYGEAWVGYIPNGRIIGLSKLPRIVDFFSKSPQTQEYLTADIADYLDFTLTPRFVGVLLRATHTCVSCRGVNKPTAYTVTSTFRTHSGVRGEAYDTTKKEFLSMVSMPRN